MLQPGCWQGSASPAAATAAPSPAQAEREAAWTPSVAPSTRSGGKPQHSQPAPRSHQEPVLAPVYDSLILNK